MQIILSDNPFHTCTLHLRIRESIDHLCINPILWIRINTQVIYRFNL